MSARKRTNKCKGGKEYWAARPMSYTPVSHRAGTNKRTKQITHSIERQQGKRQLCRDGWDG